MTEPLYASGRNLGNSTADHEGDFFMPVTPILPHATQLKVLAEEHNLLIKNPEAALAILQNVSYYRLSEYGLNLRKADNRTQYRDGVSLEQLFDLYCFDSRFRHNLIRVLEQLEIQLRTQIAYLLAKNYGAYGYLDANNFADHRIHENLLKELSYRQAKNKQLTFVNKEFASQTGGKVAIFAAVELLSFGNLASLYKIMQYQDKKELAALYGTSADYLNGWLLALVEVRNICAHYLRLYDLVLKQTPPLYKEYLRYRGRQNKIFPVLLVIKRMLRSNAQWRSLYKNIKYTLEKYQAVVDLDCIGFPQDWQNVLANPN